MESLKELISIPIDLITSAKDDNNVEDAFNCFSQTILNVKPLIPTGIEKKYIELRVTDNGLLLGSVWTET